VGLSKTQISDKEFFDLHAKIVLPDTTSASEISDREFFGLVPVASESTALPVSQEEKVEVGLLDTPLPITLGGSTLGQISIRQALKVAEPILGVFEVPIELVRQKFRDASVIRNKIKSGKLPSIGDVSDVIFGNPKTLIDAIKKVPKTGAVFRELTKPDGISKEDRFSDFSEVLEEIGVPEGPNISPFERFPVSLRGAAGFGLEILAPTIPVARGAKVVKGLVRKSAKEITKEIIPEARKIIPGAQVTKQTPTKVVPEGQTPVSKPSSTGEAIKLPKESKFRETTSARKFDMSKDREVVGLNELNSPERKSFQTTFRNAKAKGLDEKAESLADEVLGRTKKQGELVEARPRVFNDEETAGVVLKSVELKNTHEDLHRQLKGLSDDAPERVDILAKIERAEEDFGRLSEALRMSGSIAGQNLVIHKLTINRNFDLVSILNRGEVAKQMDTKNAKLTSKERAKFKELTEKLAARDKQVAELEKEVSRRTANAVLRKSRGTKKFAKMSRAERDVALNDTVARAKKLISEGCTISG